MTTLETNNISACDEQNVDVSKKYYQDLTLQELSASNWVYITELTSFQNAGGCDNKLLTSFMKVINK